MFGNNMAIDYYTTACKTAIVLLVIAILTLSRPYIDNHTRNMIDYPTYILLGTFFLLMLASAAHFMTVLFGIMGFSYNLYVLIASDSGRESLHTWNRVESKNKFIEETFKSTAISVAPTQADKAMSSTEAAIKYFTLSALSSGLIAAALSILWLLYGTLNFGKIACLISRNLRSIAYMSNFVSIWDFILIFLVYGFLFKLAAYPCHL